MAEEDVPRSNCPVCKEQYDEDGENMPRFFPCHCTACTKCIRPLTQDNPTSIWVTCPVCKKKQKVGKNVEKFPTNQYIIGYIRERRKSSSPRRHEKGVKFSMCPSHVQELSMYCPADQCKKAICPNCLLKDHAAHAAKVEDLAEKKEFWLAEINSLSKDLEEARTSYLKVNEMVLKKNEKCIASIEARKKEVIAEFDAMIKKVSDFTCTPEVIQAIQTFEEFLTTLKQMDSSETSYEEIQAGLKSAANMRRSYKNILSRKDSSQFYKYSRNNSFFGEVKLTSNTSDSAAKGNTETKASGGSTCSGSTGGNRGIGDGNEREALSKLHGSDRNGPFSKDINREESIGDTERGGIKNEEEIGIDGPQNEAGRDSPHSEDGREGDEGRRGKDGPHNERGRDGPHNEDGSVRDGPCISDRGVSFEDASGSEGGDQTTNSDIQDPPRKKPRKGSPVRILGHAVITTVKTWSNPIDIRCFHVMSCIQVNHDKILVCGKYEKVTNARSELIEYSLGTEYSSILKRTPLRGEPYGMAEVMLGGVWCLALTYQSKEREINEIDFINLNSEVVYSHSTAPHLPGLLCTLSPTTLLYEYRDNRKNIVEKLNCETSTPELVKSTLLQSTITKQSPIKCMCAVQYKGKQLVLTTHDRGSYSEMYAYSVNKGVLRLIVTNSQRDFGNETKFKHSVCKIDSAHTFAADFEGNILLYNFESKQTYKFLANGQHDRPKTLSGLFGEGCQINDPKIIRWCPITSSWIICNQKVGSVGHWDINIFNKRL